VWEFGTLVFLGTHLRTGFSVEVVVKRPWCNLGLSVVIMSLEIGRTVVVKGRSVVSGAEVVVTGASVWDKMDKNIKISGSKIEFKLSFSPVVITGVSGLRSTLLFSVVGTEMGGLFVVVRESGLRSSLKAEIMDNAASCSGGCN
jgi:hypothetical protein